MPHFDTRNPQEPNKPNRLTFLLNGGILLYVLVVASTVGMLIDSLSGLAPLPTALGEAPNGTIAFETTRDFPYDQVAEAIWVMNANGSELRRLMGAASPYSAGWSISPDGEKIAFTEELYEEVPCNSQGGCPEKVHAQINVMNADGSYQY